jgi:curved DNA-binding protein CbpA
MSADPFGVLGLAPTMDLAPIKRAYFTALRAHPPHSDPEGFARIRKAYEALQATADRATQVLAAPLDVAAALRALESRAHPTAPVEGAPSDAGEDPEAAALAATAFVRSLVALPLKGALEQFAKARSGG